VTPHHSKEHTKGIYIFSVYQKFLPEFIWHCSIMFFYFSLWHLYLYFCLPCTDSSGCYFS